MTNPEDGAPRCYLAVYADPGLPGHVTIEGGRFGNRAMPKRMSTGDMVLLYCTATYAGHDKSVPGIGLVTAVDHEAHDFAYDYLALERPVPLDFLRFAMDEKDRAKLANIRYEWLFEISRDSFRAVMQGAKLRRDPHPNPSPRGRGGKNQSSP